jgi:hypothetical protein
VSAGPGIIRPVKPDGLSWLGIFAGLGGVLLLWAGTLLSLHSGTSSEGPEATGIVLLLLLGYIVLLFYSGASFILAFVYFTAAVGLFLGKWWAWRLSITLSVLSIVLNLGQVAFIGLEGLFDLMTLFVTILVLSYLTRPHVRQFFRTRSEA